MINKDLRKKWDEVYSLLRARFGESAKESSKEELLDSLISAIKDADTAYDEDFQSAYVAEEMDNDISTFEVPAEDTTEDTTEGFEFPEQDGDDEDSNILPSEAFDKDIETLRSACVSEESDDAELEDCPDILVFDNRKFSLEKFTGEHFPTMFYAWLEYRIKNDFDYTENEAKKIIVDKLEDHWNDIRNVQDYYRLRTFVKLKCGNSIPTPAKTTMPQANESSQSDDQTNIILKIRNYFSICYGMTKKEFNDFERGLLPDWFNTSTTPYTIRAYHSVEYMSSDSFEKLSKSYDKPSGVCIFLSLLLVLYLYSEDSNIEGQEDILQKINMFEKALCTRLEAFKFDPKKDTRFDFFADFINGLTETHLRKKINNEQMTAFCGFVPFEIGDKKPATCFNEMRDFYISTYGKTWIDENEIEYKSPNFNAGEFLPFDISVLKNMVKKVAHNGEDHWLKAIKEDDKKLTNYIRLILDNRDKLADEGNAPKEKWIIPSGPFTGKHINDIGLDFKQKEFVEANCFFMGLETQHTQNIIDIFYRYKTRETILRHIMTQNEIFNKPMSGQVLKELMAVKFPPQ